MTYRKANFENPLVEKARVFMTAAHAAVGQMRKFNKPGDEPLPYSVHPEDACAILQELPTSSKITIAMLQAMLLHDVVEDSQITIELIEKEFGPEVSRLVSGMTDVSKPEDGIRAVRKAMDLAHTAEQGPDVHTLKLADLISNAPGIIENSGGFARKWMQEKGALLQILSDGDPILYEQAMAIYRNYQGRN